jgi:hypothetical protein
MKKRVAFKLTKGHVGEGGMIFRGTNHTGKNISFFKFVNETFDDHMKIRIRFFTDWKN